MSWVHIADDVAGGMLSYITLPLIYLKFTIVSSETSHFLRTFEKSEIMNISSFFAFCSKSLTLRRAVCVCGGLFFEGRKVGSGDYFLGSAQQRNPSVPFRVLGGLLLRLAQRTSQSGRLEEPPRMIRQDFPARNLEEVHSATFPLRS